MFWLFWQLVGVVVALIIIGLIIKLLGGIGSLFKQPVPVHDEPAGPREIERQRLATVKQQAAAKAAKAKQIAEHNAKIMADWRAGKDSYSYRQRHP